MSFNQHLKQGHATEKIVAALYRQAGCQVRSTAKDIPRPPYDLVVYRTKDNGNTEHFTVEVKSWDGNRGACFETDKNGRTPQYIKDCEHVDKMVRYHKSSGVAVELDNAELVNYLKSNTMTHWGARRFKGSGEPVTELQENKVGTPWEGSWGVTLNIFDRAFPLKRRRL